MGDAGHIEGLAHGLMLSGSLEGWVFDTRNICLPGFNPATGIHSSLMLLMQGLDTICRPGRSQAPLPRYLRSSGKLGAVRKVCSEAEGRGASDRKSRERLRINSMRIA